MNLDRATDIPLDDEPLTPSDRTAIDKAVESLKRNGGVSMETVLADFGLTMNDFRSMAYGIHPEERPN